jgi:hypothetical protein
MRSDQVRSTTISRTALHAPLVEKEVEYGGFAQSHLPSEHAPVFNEPGLQVIREHVVDYPTGENLTDLWRFEVQLGFVLVFNFLPGFFLECTILLPPG